MRRIALVALAIATSTATGGWIWGKDETTYNAHLYKDVSIFGCKEKSFWSDRDWIRRDDLGTLYYFFFGFNKATNSIVSINDEGEGTGRKENAKARYQTKVGIFQNQRYRKWVIKEDELGGFYPEYEKSFDTSNYAFTEKIFNVFPDKRLHVRTIEAECKPMTLPFNPTAAGIESFLKQYKIEPGVSQSFQNLSQCKDSYKSQRDRFIQREFVCRNGFVTKKSPLGTQACKINSASWRKTWSHGKAPEIEVDYSTKECRYTDR